MKVIPPLQYNQFANPRESPHCHHPKWIGQALRVWHSRPCEVEYGVTLMWKPISACPATATTHHQFQSKTPTLKQLPTLCLCYKHKLQKARKKSMILLAHLYQRTLNLILKFTHAQLDQKILPLIGSDANSSQYNFQLTPTFVSQSHQYQQ